MKFSNRKSDESVDKRVQFLLDSIYEKEGFRCKRPNDEKIDKRGVDIMLHSPNTDSILWVDEKCATHYWDRNLDTFSCELTCNRTKDHLGWFAQERNGYSATTHYMFVWVRALEKELVHISSLELALINKHDLQTYFRLSADCNADTPTSEVITKLFGQNPVVEVNKNLKVRKCEIFPEFPVNAMSKKRKDYISWDEYFMGVAELSAMRSKDPNSQVGACIVRDNKILSLGYNGMPIGCGDDIMPWGREGENLNTKYMYVCHSELNAILNAGKDLHGSTMYVTLYPCNECAKAIIQSGIKKVIFLDNKYKNTENNIAARFLFKTAGIETVQYTKSSREVSLSL